MTRRQLRKLGRNFSLQEVRQHAAKDDAWIAVDGRVYDITEHLVNHPGWHDNAAISTVLSILAHAGSDCSQVGVGRGCGAGTHVGAGGGYINRGFADGAIAAKLLCVAA